MAGALSARRYCSHVAAGVVIPAPETWVETETSGAGVTVPRPQLEDLSMQGMPCPMHPICVPCRWVFWQITSRNAASSLRTGRVRRFVCRGC